jgi:uncharacterized membrane protein
MRGSFCENGGVAFLAALIRGVVLALAICGAGWCAIAWHYGKPTAFCLAGLIPFSIGLLALLIRGPRRAEWRRGGGGESTPFFFWYGFLGAGFLGVIALFFLFLLLPASS